MRPKGFSEDPYVYPVMECQGCRGSFRFNKPFKAYNTVCCPSCQTFSPIPDDVIEQFLENIYFMNYLKNRRRGNTKPPPPIMPSKEQE